MLCELILFIFSLCGTLHYWAIVSAPSVPLPELQPEGRVLTLDERKAEATRILERLYAESRQRKHQN